MRGTLFTLICVACSVASAATVYKWVDDSGVTHYSDQPHENASKVELHEPQTYAAPKLPPQAATPAAPQAARQKPYDSCSVTQPAAEEVIFNTFMVNVLVQTSPAPRSGDRIVLTLDGKTVAGLAETGTQFTLSPVDRGAHSVQATILDGDGHTVGQSAGVTFYVRQPSQKAPNAANRPKS